MTHIPGTGQIKVKPSDEESPNDFKKSEMLSVVNVNDLKNPEFKDNDLENEVWYNQLKYWILFGSCLGGFFAILAILNIKFLFLVPLGPYTLYLGWHIRNMIKKKVK